MVKFLLVAIALVIGSSAAGARGGADFMNSPGYQRRLQESRGYVTNRSGSILPAAPVRREVRPRRRHWQ
ncbi:MAG: hypothetical protein ABWY18_20535 [Tardiphaga sp.]